MFRRCAALCLLVCLLARSARAEEVSAFDFEQSPLGDQWTVVGSGVQASRQPVAGEAPADGPRGTGLAITATGPGGVFTQPGVVPADLSRFDRLEFWVHRSEEEARARPHIDIEAQAVGADGARYWRRVPLEQPGWQKVSLPLKWFRWGQGHLPDWKHVDRVGVRLRGAAELQLDDLRLVDDDPQYGAALEPADVIELAFGDQRSVRRKDGPHAVVAGDAPELDAAQLADHLEKVAAKLAADLPELKEGPPGVLLVFGKDDDYRQFTPRLGAKLGADAPLPKSDGYTLLGVATAAWNPRYGTLRPVYTHEFVHAYLIPRLGFDNHGDWLHEGLAARTQLHFHPQPGFDKIVRAGLANPAARTPLAELASGRPIPVQRYWQAATLVELLLESPQYAPRRPALIEAFRKAGGADLSPHLPAVLNTDWAGLEADWKRWCEEKYGDKG